jgi:hypothetical protein
VRSKEKISRFARNDVETMLKEGGEDELALGRKLIFPPFLINAVSFRPTGGISKAVLKWPHRHSDQREESQWVFNKTAHLFWPRIHEL